MTPGDLCLHSPTVASTNPVQISHDAVQQRPHNTAGLDLTCSGAQAVQALVQRMRFTASVVVQHCSLTGSVPVAAFGWAVLGAGLGRLFGLCIAELVAAPTAQAPVTLKSHAVQAPVTLK